MTAQTIWAMTRPCRFAGLEPLAVVGVAQAVAADEVRVVVLDDHGVGGQVGAAAADPVEAVVEHGDLDRSTSGTFSYSGTRPSCFLISAEMTGRATEFSRPAGAGGTGGSSSAARAARACTSAISQTKRLAGHGRAREGARG